ncbi:uncharacterized protein J3D65DRAFT_264845 [Phyllosticta citribraziliensis]|uniref:Secreted protein n=1 Tax=Phyllosticta citribraziliensis TaxID=989973 RepID=A0ABR1M4M4_9PEZI
MCCAALQFSLYVCVWRGRSAETEKQDALDCDGFAWARRRTARWKVGRRHILEGTVVAVLRAQRVPAPTKSSPHLDKPVHNSFTPPSIWPFRCFLNEAGATHPVVAPSRRTYACQPELSRIRDAPDVFLAI